MQIALYSALSLPFSLLLTGLRELSLTLARGIITGVVYLLLSVGFRVRTVGQITVPSQGGALMVANHVSFVDALLVAMVSPRPIRFVMDRSYFKPWWCQWLFRLFRAIPITSERRDPTCLREAMSTIDEALNNGELVMIFPEGRLTGDGALSPFRPGVERILAHRPVPVVTLALRGLWGSRLSRCPAHLRAELAQGGLRRDVEVVWGPVVDGGSTSAQALQETIFAVRGEQR